MALMPCAYCSRVPRGKLHACIFAWQSESGRRALRTRSCPLCLPDAIAAFGPPLPEEGDYVQVPTTCSLCGDPLKHDELAVTYLTWYESDGKHSAMFATCQKDAEERRYIIRSTGEELIDRAPTGGPYRR